MAPALLIGGVIAFASVRVLESLLFGVAPGDWRTFAAVLTLVALLSSYAPARRAMRVDPLTALRAE